MSEKSSRPQKQSAADANPERFEAVNLSFNVGVPNPFGRFGDLASCNSGGSVICDPGTGGCGSGGMTCVGTSCSGSSATRELNFDSHILVERDRLDALREELAGLVKRFTS